MKRCGAALVLLCLASAAIAESKDDVAALIRQLSDKDEVVRLKAAKSLGKLGADAKEAVPALTSALKDTDEDVRTVAATALARIKDALGDDAPKKVPEKLNALLKDLQDKSPAVRRKALGELGDMGMDGVDGCEQILALVFDKSPEVQQAAWDALEKVNPRLYTPVLTLLVDRAWKLKLDAIKQIGDLGTDGKPAIPTLIRVYKNQAAFYPSGFGEQPYGAGILSAIHAIDPENKDYVSLILYAATITPASLGEKGGFRDTDARTTAIGLVLEAVKNGNADGPQATKAFVSALGDPDCRVQAIKALGELGPDAKNALPLLKKLKTDPQAVIRDAADEAVKKIE